MSSATQDLRGQIGEPPRDPLADVPEAGIVAMGKELVSEFIEDDVPGLAAEVAYHAVFSIPALLVVLVTLGGVVDNVFDFDVATRLTEIIKENAPASTQDLLLALVETAVAQVDGGAASLGLASSLLVALWAGSNAVGALIKAFNRAYGAIEQRPFHRKKAMAILLTIVLGLVVNLAVALWVFGGDLGGWLAREFHMGSTFDWAWNLSRFPVGFIVNVLVLGLLYYYGPTMKQEFRWVLPGAVLSTAIWGALVFGFSLYIRVASPGSAYGALSGMIVFLLLLYLTALIFIGGAEFNAVLARRHDRRYRRAMGHVETAQTVAPVEVRAPRAGEAVPATLGTMALGVVTVLGIVVASVLRSRG